MKLSSQFLLMLLMMTTLGCSIPRIPDRQVRFFEQNTEKKVIEKKNRALATVLAVIPGAGQAYAEDWGDAALTFFTFWLVVPWVFSFADANLTSKYINYEYSYNEYNPDSK